MDSNEKVYGILSYFWFLFIIPLLAGGKEFSRYHANQGLVLFILEVILGIVVGIVSAVVGWIPFVGMIVSSVLGGIVGIIMLIFMVLGIYRAASGEMKPLPLIGAITIIK